MTVLPVQRPEFDTIYWQTVGKHARTICITSANAGEGATALALALAWRSTAAGLRSLIIDTNMARPTASVRLGQWPARWTPRDGSARNAVRPAQGLDLDILPAPSGVDPMAFRDPQTWRRLLEEEFAEYGMIVVDTSSVNGFNDKGTSAEAVAAACTATVLVVLAGVTSERSVRAAMERLTDAGASVSGVVLNDRLNPSVADELCRELDRFRRLAPRLCDRAQAWVRQCALLNQQI